MISNLKITKEDKNSVPIRLVIANKEILSHIICRMLNVSMANGFFPKSLKIAKIIPIFKKGEKSDPSNYRPISILPYLSKIFEMIIHCRLTSYLSNNSIISPHQFGFQRGISTLDAVISFTEQICHALNTKQSILNIFID